MPFSTLNQTTMKRKVLISIGVVIAILLLLYWLFMAEEISALQ